ncbi:MAG TPA: cytidine deaminase [Acetobacteraceae bacterium]|nr:cytidine deaminase [Acetobacteraceae bacterium]
MPAIEPGLPGSLSLTEADRALIEAARETLLRHYRPFWHMVAAALRTRDGHVFTGLHLGATVGRLSICAEPVAVGRAILEGDGTIDTIVAVRHPKPEESVRAIAIVPPCGACRELIFDHDPEALMIIPARPGTDPAGATAVKVPVRSLLPAPYQR